MIDLDDYCKQTQAEATRIRRIDARLKMEAEHDEKIRRIHERTGVVNVICAMVYAATLVDAALSGQLLWALGVTAAAFAVVWLLWRFTR